MALIDRYQRLREQAGAESIATKLRAIDEDVWYGPQGSAERSILAEELAEVRARGQEERARDSLEPPDLLILCVGYSPEPLLLAVAHHAPANVVLLKETHLDEEYLRSLGKLWDTYRDLLGVPAFSQLAPRITEDSATGVFLIVREIAETWRKRSQGRIVLDITGAKKSMIAGAFLAAGFLDLESSYVDFAAYDVLLRRPPPGSSRPAQLKHPYQLFKLREEAQLAEDFDRRRYREAHRLATALWDMVKDPEVEALLEPGEADRLTQRYKTVIGVSGAYALWSEGFYKEAVSDLAKCPAVVSPATLELLGPAWPTSDMTDHEIVKALSPAEVFSDPTVALAYFLDMLVWNTEDRIAEYPRDCFLRLYGTIDGPKYHGVESRLGGEQWRPLSPRLAHRYRHEVEALAAAGPAAEAFPRWNDLVDAVHAKIPEKVWRALELLGNPNEVHVQVTYPVLQGQDTEGEHFQWFVENDKVQKKALEAIPRQGDLPTLERYQQRPRPRRER